MNKTQKNPVMFWYRVVFAMPIILWVTVLTSISLGVFDSEFFTAIKKGDIDKVEHIISLDKNKANEYCFGLSPLHRAAYSNRLEISRILLLNGADPNSKGARCDITPIFIASANDNLNLMNLLIEYGADVNIGDMFNRTPLINSVNRGSLSTVKFLLNHGADIEPKDSRGMSAMDYSVSNNNKAIVDLLTRHSNCSNSSKEGDNPPETLEKTNINDPGISLQRREAKEEH